MELPRYAGDYSTKPDDPVSARQPSQVPARDADLPTRYPPLEAGIATIIINNYNYGQYLGDAIESALVQTYPNVEVIVVDDGSTDDSRSIVRSFASRVIPILKENGGQASAFNAGLAVGRGEVTIFLDADDLLLPDTVQSVMRTIASQPDVVKVQYRLAIIDADGLRSGGYIPPIDVQLPNGDLQSSMLSFPDDVPTPPTSGNAFSTSVLRRIFPIPEQEYGQTLADLYLHNLTPLFGRVVSLDHVGGLYRVHGANLHHSAGLDLSRMRRVIELSMVGHGHIRTYAQQLGIEGVPLRPEDILSVTYVANRLLSWRLERTRHPIVGESRWRLICDGTRAAARRVDVPWYRRAAYGVWFPVVAVAPTALVRMLGNRALGAGRI